MNALKHNAQHNLYIWHGDYHSRHIPKKAGFNWHPEGRRWITNSPFIAYKLREYADKNTKHRLFGIGLNILNSKETTNLVNENPPIPKNQKLLPYQSAGIDYMAKQIQNGHKHVGCFDQQGLGKTIQAIVLANKLGLYRILIICPASLRLNWKREAEKWLINPAPIIVHLTGKDKPKKEHTSIISYDLVNNVQNQCFDLVVIDECHYLKNPKAKRTKKILNKIVKPDTPTIYLSGTPIPNGRPNEMFNILKKSAPDAIDNMGIWDFMRRFCEMHNNGFADVVTGAKNTDELFTRLRGSGFMLRREKKDVLKDLPEKRYKMVVFPATDETTKILEREQEFDVDDIIKHGVPVGSGLPELRCEMGVAKAPQCINYVKDLLIDGTDKIVVFGHHIGVMNKMFHELSEYNPVMIIGGTPARARQDLVDRFQNDPECRVFLGNEAAEEGITLTSACDVVMVEPEWVPGKNEQRADRLHRIGQTKGVIVHYLVVERSLDALILKASAKKNKDINNVLEGETS